MTKQTADSKTTLAELATEHAALWSKGDKAARFRCRMIAGRARKLIKELYKTDADQEAAFEAWDKQSVATKPKASFGFFTE